MASYYKVIDGIRYDRRLLETADTFVEGGGDGRISVKDAQKLVQYSEDGRGITQTEVNTLGYIRKNYNWTDKAGKWFDDNFIPPSSILTVLQQIAKEEFLLPGLDIRIEEHEVKIQNQLDNNKIFFEEAFQLGLNSFMTDASDIESPRSLVMESEGLFREKFDSDEAWETALTERLKMFMNKGMLSLIPLVFPDNKKDWHFYPPENGSQPRTTGFFI